MTEFLKRWYEITRLIGAILSGPFSFICLVLIWGVDKVVEVSGSFLQEIASFALPGSQFDLSASVFVPLSRINAFIPLAENWVMMLAYLSLLLNVTIFRFIKSLIPGMSN